jgi:cysteine desulfurase / selenocysteine lyase
VNQYARKGFDKPAGTDGSKAVDEGVGRLWPAGFQSFLRKSQEGVEVNIESGPGHRDYGDEFPLDPGLIYLNHAAVSPWPRRTAEAVQRFAEENLHRGARDYPCWLETESQLRGQCRALVNAPSADDIALLKNTSEALSAVAHGLEWRAGDNVVISDQEFPSNRIVWQSLARQGVETRRVDLSHGPSPEQALCACMDERTRLLSVSSVQYVTGLRLDLERLGAFCRERGVMFCIDAIQSLGAVPLDVQACGADFVMADGHKWLLAPEGCALFYARAGVRDRLQLRQYGWHMVEEHLDFSRQDWQVAMSARRFECGSPNMLGIHALSASLALLDEVGMDEVAVRVLANSAFLIEALGRLPDIEVLTPEQPGRYAGIVTFRHQRVDSAELHRRLLARNVICARRGSGVRFSPHFYITRTQLEAAVTAVDEETRTV